LTIVQSQLLYVGELTGTVVTSARLFALPRGQPVILIQATQGVSFAMIGHSSSARASWVGIVPAAGEGRRLALGGYPKELMPIVFRRDGDDRIVPELVIERCLRALASTGVDVIVVVVNDSKLEILRQVGDGARYGCSVVYIQQPQPLGLADAVIRALAPFPEHHALLALPDTIFSPGCAALQLRQRLARGGGELALAVFPTATPELLAPVIHRDGLVQAVLEKPVQPPIANTWGLAAWSPRFSAALPELVADTRAARPSVSLAFARWVERGFDVIAEDFPDGSYFDLGTPSGLADAFLGLGGAFPNQDKDVA
jgi:glucose-1-phosphate thymidylyltransferase